MPILITNWRRKMMKNHLYQQKMISNHPNKAQNKRKWHKGLRKKRK